MESNYYNLYPVRCKCGNAVGRHATTLEELMAEGIPQGQALTQLGVNRLCCRLAMQTPSRVPLYRTQEDELLTGMGNLHVEPARTQTIANPLQVMGGTSITGTTLQTPRAPRSALRTIRSTQSTTIQTPQLLPPSYPAALPISGVESFPGTIAPLQVLAPLPQSQMLVSVGAGYQVPVLTPRIYYGAQGPKPKRVPKPEILAPVVVEPLEEGFEELPGVPATTAEEEKIAPQVISFVRSGTQFQAPQVMSFPPSQAPQVVTFGPPVPPQVFPLSQAPQVISFPQAPQVISFPAPIPPTTVGGNFQTPGLFQPPKFTFMSSAPR